MKPILKDKMLLDGSMGAMLIARGAGSDSAAANLTNPLIVEAIQRGYCECGSDMLAANTFGVNAKMTLDHEAVIEAAVGSARRAAAGRDTLVAFDVSPCGLSYEPLGDDTYEAAEAFYRRTIGVGAPLCDAVMCETFTDLSELIAALRAAKAVCELPILTSMSVNALGRTFWGVSLSQFAEAMNEYMPYAAGLNCELPPKEMKPLLRELRALLDPNIRLLAQANRGAAVVRDGETVYELPAEEFASGMLAIYDDGCDIIGGCCGADAECIALLAKGMGK